VYGGFLNINNTLSGNSTVEYIERRNREGSQIILPNFGASISNGNGKWDFRAGIELSMLGEKVNYSPYSNGDYYKTSGGWQPYQHLVTDSDSTFIFGILFINTSLKLVNDSTYTTKIDTLNGPHYDEKIVLANGVNKSYYLEFPLEASYTHFINRWGFGVSAGISPSMLLSTNGYYLTTDQKTTKQLNKETSTKMFLNGRLNLELSYVVNERLRLMVRPTYRKNLTKVKDGSETKHHYSSYGLNVGALFKIR
jgi:hypothetical protein